MRPTPESSVTQDLVERARHGDREAFGALVDRYRERLEALVHLRLGKRLRQKVEPEDVLQEVYLRALPALQSFQWTDKGSFFRWLGAIAEHVIQDLARRHLEAEKRALSHERSLEREIVGEGEDERERVFEARDASPSEILRRWERFERLEAALDRLHPDHREVIILSVVRGLPTREIAERMHRSPEAVGMLLLRAVRKLREEFGTTDSFHLPASGIASLDGGSGPKGEDREARQDAKPPDSGPARTS
jgi:RNA polymerase sigma-70 factor (ECF subfamily)